MREVDVAVRDGRPLHFIHKQQKMIITEIADRWRETGRWWDGELLRDFFLVNTANGAFLLCRDSDTDYWYAKPIQ